MARFWICVLCAIAALGLCGCTVTVHNTQVGTVLEDGSVYLGWTLISRKKGKDFMLIGQEHGKFSSLRFKVESRPLALDKMVVQFGNGETWSPKLRSEFPANGWSRQLALPGGQRYVERVTFFGQSTGKKGQMAKVELYGYR